MLKNYVKPILISTPVRSVMIYSLYNLKRGSASGGRDIGRAPSTAEEFTRAAEEKARQGVASQTVEKAYDGAAEAVNVSGDSTAEVEDVKKEFQKKKEGEEYHKKLNDDDGLPINTFKGT